MAKDELVIYSYHLEKSRHQLLKIKDTQLVGKVTAIQATEELAYTLTPEEQAVYGRLKWIMI